MTLGLYLESFFSLSARNNLEILGYDSEKYYELNLLIRWENRSMEELNIFSNTVNFFTFAYWFLFAHLQKKYLAHCGLLILSEIVLQIIWFF